LKPPVTATSRSRVRPVEPFDVIVLDVMLPGRDGFDVAKTIRQQGIQTPILMLTARTQVVDRVVGLKLGADDY
jgi:DNA-binding response OmpR family regulator